MTKQKSKPSIPPYRTPFNPIAFTATKTTEPSQTVQGDSYTVRELLEKHVQGIMPPVGLSPQYDHDEPTFDDDTTLRNPDLDLTDIDTIKEKIKDVHSRAQSARTDRTSVASSGATRRGSAAEEPSSGAASIEETSEAGGKTSNK